MKIFPLVLLVLQTFMAHPQSGTRISGTVLDERGEPVPGANIILENTYDGTSSDLTGAFSFVSEETGEFFVTVRYIGYKTFREPVTLSGTPLVLTVQLREEINQLEAVTITAGSFTASDKGRTTVFKPIDIATTAGATADIAGALNTLPGTQKVGETGRLFVRGGDGDETRTFIDGMLVFEAYSPAATNTPGPGTPAATPTNTLPGATPLPPGATPAGTATPGAAATNTPVVIPPPTGSLNRRR